MLAIPIGTLATDIAFNPDTIAAWQWAVVAVFSLAGWSGSSLQIMAGWVQATSQDRARMIGGVILALLVGGGAYLAARDKWSLAHTYALFAASFGGYAADWIVKLTMTMLQAKFGGQPPPTGGTS